MIEQMPPSPEPSQPQPAQMPLKSKKKLSVKIVFVIWIMYVFMFLSLPFSGLFSVSGGKVITKLGISMIKPQHAEFEKFMKAIDTGDASAMTAMLDEQLRAGSKEAMVKIINDFKALGPLKNNYFLNFQNSFSKDNNATSMTTYWADYERGSILIKFSLAEKSGTAWIDGFNYKPTGKTYSELYKFPLWNLSVFHYIFALAAFFLMYLTFTTLIMCLESGVKLKWLWVIFISLGFGTLSIVWRESPLFEPTIEFNLTAIIFFSTSAVKAPLDTPMLLSLAFPIGAIVFRLFVKNKR